VNLYSALHKNTSNTVNRAHNVHKRLTSACRLQYMYVLKSL